MEDPTLAYCEVLDDSRVDTELALQKLEVNEPTYCEVDDLNEDTPVSLTSTNIAQLRRIPTPRSVTVFSRTCQRCQRESSSKEKVILRIAVAIFAILSIVFMALYFTAERKYKARVYQNSSVENHNTSHWKNDTFKPCPICKNTTKKPKCTSGVTAKNCKELYKMNIIQDGVYSIDPDGLGSFNVSCDMSTDEGGWTVFQRRMDGSEDFYRGWNEYKNGFGNMLGEFWLGLDKIHRLTKNSGTELRIDLEDFEGNKAFAKFKIFKVEGESEMYKLTVDEFTGLSTCRIKTTDGRCCEFPLINKKRNYFSCITADTRNTPWCGTTKNYDIDGKWGNCTNPWPGDAGDSLTFHNGMKFSTKDKDNDVYSGSCAVEYKAAWWYNACHSSNLNGKYLHGVNTKYAQGVIWNTWRGHYYSLKKTEIKIRPQKP